MITATDEITFIGTATTLIKVAGFSILTDPNFLHRGDRAYVGMGLTTRRLTEPALSIQHLPELDFSVLSHHHGDHSEWWPWRTSGSARTASTCSLNCAHRCQPPTSSAARARLLRAAGRRRRSDIIGVFP